MVPAVTAIVNWFQRTVPWSNSRRAWLERLAFLMLVSATTALVLSSGKLPLWSVVLAWGVLLVLFGFLLRQGWFFVFGPVLFYDLVRSARRTRTYVFRFLYILLLFAVLCCWYLSWIEDRSNRNPGANGVDAAQFTMMYFLFFMIAQLGLVLLMTPAYLAGAISEEKERKTLEFVLATDLRNREIVLGKFVARLLHLTTLLLAGLPILSALQFMGGIDPNLLLAGFAGTGLTMLSIAGVSIFASTISRRTRDALLIVYLSMLAYVGLWLLCEVLNGYWGASTFPSTWNWQSPITFGDVCQWMVYAFRVGNPGSAIYRAVGTGTIVGSTVWSVLEEYAIFHGLLAGASLLGSVALLRRSALALPKPTRGRTWFGLGRKRRLPRIGNYPMIWKEVYLERGFRLHWLLRSLFLLLVVLSLVPLGFIFTDFFTFSKRTFFAQNPWESLGLEMTIYVRTVGMLVAMLGLIAVGIRAATSVRNEREKDTMDALLTSPLSSEEILFGKWLGSVLSVRWVGVWLLFIWGLGALTGGMNFLMFPLLIIVWLVYAAAMASLGLWFSIICRTSLQSLLATLFTALTVSCGHWLLDLCCCLSLNAVWGHNNSRAVEDAASTIAQIQMSLTPPVVFSMLPFRTNELAESGSRDWHPIVLVLFTMLGAVFWAFVGWGVWRTANKRFKRLTNRTGPKLPDCQPVTVLSSWPEK